jgi:hypothetical protein
LREGSIQIKEPKPSKVIAFQSCMFLPRTYWTAWAKLNNFTALAKDLSHLGTRQKVCAPTEQQHPMLSPT